MIARRVPLLLLCDLEPQDGDGDTPPVLRTHVTALLAILFIAKLS